jgi:hypothetical protein
MERHRIVKAILFAAYGLPLFASMAICEMILNEKPHIGHYEGLLTPTADSVKAANGYLLTFPVAGAAQVSFPITRRSTVGLYAGGSGYPAGLLGSVYMRIHILRPDRQRWGLATQVQSGAAFSFSSGEGNGGVVHAVTLVVSSPIKAARINFGAAVHTMPGSEFQPEWDEAKDYDFRNPQPTFFISASYAFRRVSLFNEFLWIAPGADDGWDSLLADIIGVDFMLGKTKLKVGTGLLIRRFGSTNPLTLPIPPVFVLAFQL